MIVSVVFWDPPVDKLTVGGENLVRNPQVQPVWLALKLTVPLKLPRLATVTVVLADEPTGTVSVFGLADKEKPRTCTVTVMDRC